MLTPLPGQLALRARRDELSHAYIVSGPDQSAAEDLATALAAAMVCESAVTRPCGVCKGCRKVLRGVHPDVIRLAPEEGKDFTVAQARALRTDAYVTPNEAPRKVYLITQAQRMNPSAQNALLKVLEEGPRHAAFLLVTDNPSALLETIRSRCEGVTLAGEARGNGDEKTQALAGELAKLLLEGDGWAVAARCVPLEKGKREDTLALWEALREALSPLAAGRRGKKAARLMEGLGDVLLQARQNVNLGALWGKLYALAGE